MTRYIRFSVALPDTLRASASTLLLLFDRVHHLLVQGAIVLSQPIACRLGGVAVQQRLNPHLAVDLCYTPASNRGARGMASLREVQGLALYADHVEVRATARRQRCIRQLTDALVHGGEIAIERLAAERRGLRLSGAGL